MPQTDCQGTSIWEYQNDEWVMIQDNCSGDCLEGFQCLPYLNNAILGDPQAEAAFKDYLDILRNPKPGDIVQAGCLCQ